MKQKNDFRPIQKRASELGVFIIAIDFQAKIVLADNGRDFVTWRYWMDQEASCHFEHGHYFGYNLTSKDEQLSKAREDYQHKIDAELFFDKTYRIVSKDQLEVSP